MICFLPIIGSGEHYGKYYEGRSLCSARKLRLKFHKRRHWHDLTLAKNQNEKKKYVVSQIFVQSWNPKRLMKLSLCSVNVDCIRTKVWETTHSCLRKKRVVFRLMLTCRGANIRLFGVKSPVFEHDTNTGSCISGLGVRQAKTFTFFYRSRYFYDPPSPIEHYSYQSSRSTYFLVKMNVHTFSKDLFYLEV